MLRHRLVWMFLLMISFMGAGCSLNVGNGNTSEFCKPFKVSHLKMNIPRARHTMTTLDDGNIFIMGGLSEHHMDGLWTGEIFNPKLKTFKNTPPLYMARYSHVAVKLKDGKVLLLGGMGDAQLDGPHAPVEIFDPKTLKSTKIPNTYYEGFNFTANLLPDGRVLIVEGSSQKAHNTATDIMMFDPQKQTIESWGSLHIPRQQHSALTLKNGNVLVAGGNRRGMGSIDSIFTLELIDLKNHKVELVYLPTYEKMYPEATKFSNIFHLKALPVGDFPVMLELENQQILFPRIMLLFDVRRKTFSRTKPLLIEGTRVNGVMLPLNPQELFFIGGMLSKRGKEKIDSVPAEIYNINTEKSHTCIFYSDYLENPSVTAINSKGFVIGGGFGEDGNTTDIFKMIVRD